MPTSDDHRALDVFGKGNVTIQGVSISDVDSGQPAGGAVRVAGPNASLRLNDIVMTDNQALERGGAIACENCKRLDIGGMFQIQDNSAGISELTEGGAIWTDSPTKIVGAARPLAGFGPARITENNANPLH